MLGLTFPLEVEGCAVKDGLSGGLSHKEPDANTQPVSTEVEGRGALNCLAAGMSDAPSVGCVGASVMYTGSPICSPISSQSMNVTALPVKGTNYHL